MNLGKLREIVKDGEAWHAAVLEVAKSQTRLSAWTTEQQYKIYLFVCAGSSLLPAGFL